MRSKSTTQSNTVKHCSKCDENKPLSAFGRNRARPDGLCYWCKSCMRESVKRVNHSPHGKAAANRSYARYPERRKARQFVNNAVAAGRLPRSRTLQCSKANSDCNGPTEYHHHLGYAKEHWLDVIPLCENHHELTDTPTKS